MIILNEELLATIPVTAILHRGSIPMGMTVSPDHQHLAYWAIDGDSGRTIVLDNERGQTFENAHSIYFSPDSRRIAFFVEGVAGASCVVDGKASSYYDRINITDWRIGPNAFGPTFSEDNQHIAFTGRRGNSWYPIIDDEEGNGYKRASDPIFSPDSRHTAYLAETDAGMSAMRAILMELKLVPPKNVFAATIMRTARLAPVTAGVPV